MTIAEIFNTSFLLNLVSIIMIDLVLAGDNSIVIAMAVQSLPKKKRFQGILFGAAAAVLLRVIFTFFASQLLGVSFVKLIGGLLIFWIAIKLLHESQEEHHTHDGAKSVWGAVWMILVADFTMSLDNILAVAGASHGSLPLLLFGLGLSIPLVVFASTLLSKLMDRFKIIVWIGGLILGKVAGEMIITDPWLIRNLGTVFNFVEMKNNIATANHTVVLSAEIICIGIILLVSLLRRKIKPAVAKNAESE